MRRLLLVALVLIFATSAQGQTATPTLGALPAKAGVTGFGAMQYGAFTLDPASIAALLSLRTIVTINGLQQGDMIVVYPPATLETALVFGGADIPGNNQLAVRLGNLHSAATDGASLVWNYVWWNRTQQNEAQSTPTP